MNEEIVMHLSSAADRWERTHPIIGFGELRVHDALRDAVKCIKETSKLYASALSLIERLEAERDAALAKVPKWISVEERLPEKLNENNQAYLTEEVIGFDDEECAYIGQFMVYKHDGHQTFFDGHYFRDDITHWMPTPEPPEEEANETTD